MLSPKVSVLMITYNQEKFIAQAIDSALMQETNFFFEIVIGEDCSTDGTREICQAYQEKFPDRIRLLAREKNLGMFDNFLFTFQECKGQYLAVLEGDDYWVDALKLQKQADFLDNNSEFAMVFTRTEAFYQDENRPGYEIPPPGSGPYVLENLLRLNFIANCSVMYRQGLANELPRWLYKLDMLDWPLHILHAQHGKIGFVDDITAKYRIHPGSQFSSRRVIDNLKSIFAFYKDISPYLGKNYRSGIHKLKAETCKEIAGLAYAEGNYLDGKKYSLYARLFSLLSAL